MSIDSTTILIVEDEPAIIELVSFTVKASGWDAFSVSSTSDAWNFLLNKTPQLIILDWMLPDQSGIKLLSKMRSDKNFRDIPVIMLTAKSMEEDKITGLDHGADDYMTKPFSPRELTSRIKAILRRKSPEHGQEALQVGSVHLDPLSCTVSIDQVKIEIGHAEYKLLKFFMANTDRVFSRSQLLDKVWGDHVDIEERTVDVHVLRLRKALGSQDVLLKTIRSVGYIFSQQ